MVWEVVLEGEEVEADVKSGCVDDMISTLFTPYMNNNCSSANDYEDIRVIKMAVWQHCHTQFYIYTVIGTSYIYSIYSTVFYHNFTLACCQH